MRKNASLPSKFLTQNLIRSSLARFLVLCTPGSGALLNWGQAWQGPLTCNLQHSFNYLRHRNCKSTCGWQTCVSICPTFRCPASLVNKKKRSLSTMSLPDLEAQLWIITFLRRMRNCYRIYCIVCQYPLHHSLDSTHRHAVCIVRNHQSFVCVKMRLQHNSWEQKCNHTVNDLRACIRQCQLAL